MSITWTLEFLVPFRDLNIRTHVTHDLIHSSIDSDAFPRSEVPLLGLSAYICAVIHNMKECALIKDALMSGVVLHQT